MAICIEPMITRGSRFNAELDDGWTVITADGSRAAHFEHTVAITSDGPWVLTARRDEQNHFAERSGVRLEHPDDTGGRTDVVSRVSDGQ
jgi:hypothetical protein